MTLPNQGSNSIVATVTDSLGNTGSSTAVVDTLDNIAPAVTITSAAEAGHVANQTITGTIASGGAALTVGQTVTLTDNGTTLGTATVQSDGTFSVSVTLPNQGANSIVATVTDSYGNTGSSAAAVDTLDNIAPTVTITSAAEASNVAAQTITGFVASGGAAAVVGQTVTLTDNGTILGTATVQSNGSFTASVTLPHQGANSIVAVVTDSYGNTGSSAAVVDTLDSIAPTVTITSAAEASNVAAQTISGTVASGGAAVVVGQTVTLTDNGTTLGTATVQSNGSFTASVTLPHQGANSIVAVVTDSFGNTGSSAAVVDTLDSIAPTVTITSAAEAGNVAAQTISGTVASGGAAVVVGQTVTLTDNGTILGTATVQSNGSFTASVTLPNQGANAIVAVVTDSYGNTGSSTAVVDTLDNIAPTVTISSAAEASNVAAQTISGTVASGGAAVVVGQTVTLTDNGTTLGTATVQANGSFTASVTLPNQGANSIVAAATDGDGNTGSSTAVVDTLDNIAPTVTITSAAESSANANQTITGTVASGGAAVTVGQTVTLTDNGTAFATSTVQSDGTFSVNVTLANQGANAIVATVTDSYGNTGSSAAVVDTLANGSPTADFGSIQSSAAVFGFSGGNWTVTVGGNTDTLHGVERVQFADKTFELVDQFGAGIGGYQSVQAAVDQASGGETILIAPGTYTETKIPAPYSSTSGGLYIDTPNLTLQGVAADGAFITSAAQAQSSGPTIVSGAETDFGSNLFIGPDASGTTIQGLHLAAGAATTNKLVESWANDFTIENSFIDTFYNGADTGAAAIYIDAPVNPISQYLIEGNILNEGIYVANAVGTAADGISTTQVISNNVFEGTFDNTSGDGRYDMIAVQGQIPGVAWQPDPAQVPTITGNTRVDNQAPFIFRMTEANPALFPSAGAIATVLAQNTDASTSYAYVLNPDGTLHLADANDGSGDYERLYIANGLETLNEGLTAPNAIYGSARDTIDPGDTIVMQTVGTTVDDVTVDGLTIKPDASSTALTLDLDAGVRTLTLADYAANQGAGVTVVGNNLGDMLTANSGNDTLIGGTGIDTVHLAATLQASNFVYDAVNADWRVSTAGATETLTNVEAVVDGQGHRFLLVGAGSQYTTIQAAVNAASNGDTILIAPGSYTGNVNIAGKAIDLEGFGGVTLHGSITESGTLNGALTINGIAIDATGQQYGVLVSASSTDFAGSVTLDNTSIANAKLNGFAYIEAGNGSTPTLTNTIGSISILNSTFSGNATQTTGANGRGDILLYGYNGNFTVDNVTIGNPGAGAQKAIQLRGVQSSADVVNVGPYQPSGNISLTDLSVSGSYAQDLLAFYRFAELGSFSASGVTLNAAAPWGLLNFDEVGGTIDLSNGITATNLANAAPIAAEQGLGTNSTFVGTSGNDVLVANGGSDTLEGGAGANTYVYSSTGGNDVITDAGSQSELIFTDIASTGVTVSRGSGSDLVVTVVATGKTVTISGQLSASATGVLQSLNFSNGVVWTAAQISQSFSPPSVTITSAAVAGNVANQTISGTVASSGIAAVAGKTVTLTDNGATLGTAVVQSNGTFTASVTLPNQGANAIVATVTDSLGNTGSSAAVVDILDNIAPTVTITSAAESSDVATQTITGTVSSGGAALVVGQIVTLTDNGTILGTATVQSNGSFSASVTLPNQGSNSIVAAVTDSFGNTGSSAAVNDTLEQASGYHFVSGQGRVSVAASVGNVIMGPGITADDVVLQSNNFGDLTISVAGDSTDSVVINGDLTDNQGVVRSGLGQILLSDGTVLNLENNPLTFTWFGNASNYSLSGSDFGANLFDVTTGNGSISFGNINHGGNGQNTIEYAEGDGRLSVSLNGGTGVLELGGGITAGDVDVQSNNFGDLTVSFNGDTADSVVVNGDLTDNQGVVRSGLSQIQFSDGTVLNLEQNPLTFTWLGNSPNFSLSGSDFGTNLFDITNAGSIGFGNSNDGGNGLNTIAYSQGSGRLNVSLNGGTGTLVLGPGITASDVDVQSNNFGDLTVSFNGRGNDTTDSVVINGDLTDNEGVVRSGLSQIQFSDGTVLNLEQNPLTFTWLGNSSNYSLSGSDFGANLFDITTGNGSIGFGNTNDGGNGLNTIEYSKGDGRLNVSLNGGTGILELGGGVSAGDVNVQSDSFGDLTIGFHGDTTDSIVINSDVTESEGVFRSGLGQIQFSDGTVVDTLDAFAPTVSITSAAESGNVATQTVAGTVTSSGAAVVVGQTVTLTDNDAILGTATVQANGSFSANVTLPNEGANAIVASVTDSLGFTGLSAAVVDTLDNIAPTVTITSAAEAGNVAAQTITGTVVSGGVASVVGQTVTLTDNGTTLATTTVQANDTFTVAVTLPNQGTNSVVATVSDAYGNTASSAAIVDTLNDLAPSVTITSSAEAGNGASQTIAGTVVPGGTASVVGQTVTLTDNGATLATTTVQADGSFTANVTLPNQGANSIIALVTDNDGNAGSSAAVVDTLDNVAPTVTITSAAETSDVAAQTITGTVLSGGVAAVVGQTVTLTDNGTTLGAATVQSNGTFTASVTLPNEGTNAIIATVTDSYGNAGSSAAVDDTLVADSLAVTLSGEVLADDTGASSTDDVTSDGEVTLTGTTSAGATVAIFDGATDVGAATVSGTSWSFSTNLAAGTHQLDATASDAFGDSVTSAPAQVIVVDDTPPQPVVTADNPFIVGTNIDVSLSGTSEPDSVVQAFDGTTLLGVATANAAGTWTLDAAPTWDGHNSISLVATDLAGNVGTYTMPVADADAVPAFYAPTASGGFVAGSGALDLPWQQDGISTVYVGVPASDVYLQANGFGDLTLHILGDAVDDIFMPGVLTDRSGVVTSGVPLLDFSDGTFLSLGGAMTFTWFGVSNNYNLTGSNFGANLFEIAVGANSGSVTFGNTNNGGNGQNTIDYAEGSGNLSVNLNGGAGTIAMGSGLTASDVYVEANGFGDLIVGIVGDSSDSILVHNDLTDSGGIVRSSVSQIGFSDGTAINLTQNPLTFTWFGNANNYNLTGANFGFNLFDITAGSGSVTFGNTNNGGNGQNTIDYAKGDGSLSVSLNAGTGTIAMGSGLTASNVYVEANGFGDLIVGIVSDSSDSILVHNDLTDSGGTVASGISQIQFSDGTAINLEQNPLTFTWFGTANNYNLTGANFGFNLFDITAGSGSVTFGNTNNGGNGQNTIDYAEGDRSLSVNLNGGTGTIAMGSGLTAGDVYVEADGSGDLIVGILGDTSDSILVHNDLTDSNGTVRSGLSQIQFSDGTAIDLTQNPLTFTWLGNANNYNLTGANFGFNLFDITAGSGSVTFGNTNNGGNGQNTIDYAEGDRSLSVNLNGGTGTIAMGSSLTASDVYVEANGFGDLIVGILGDTSDSIVVHNDLTDSNGTVRSGLSQITFGDGTAINLTQNPLTFTWLGNANNYNLTGANFGFNLFDITTGNGSVTFGNTNNGGNGQNTIDYAEGDGSLSVNLNGGTGTIQMGSGLTASDVYLQSNGFGDLIVGILGDTADSIIVHNDLTDSNGTVNSGLSQIGFSDGTAINLAQNPLTFTWLGTSNASLSGSNYGANVFELGQGSESATGGNTNNGGNGNNTYIASSSTGHATISPNEAAGTTNELDFVGGITSNDLWFQQSGNDLKIDLMGTNTQVDVSGWFSSSSNQLQEISAGSLKIDSQVSQLVQAMATYSANNSGFDPTAPGVTAVPNDSNLQTALAAAWHS